MSFRVAAILLFVAAPAQAREAAVDLVDPFIGTLGDYGQLSPAAVAPYGMVQLGPDTFPANHAGYDFAARMLRGFSHTRGVGVGCGGAGGDLLVSLAPAGSGPLLTIDKARERASAGRYRVAYANGIVADMTATRGAGLLRFTVRHAGRYVLRVDAAHGYSRRHAATLTRRKGELAATMTAGTVCDEGRYTLYTASRVTVNGRPTAGFAVAGPSATLSLTLRPGTTVDVRTGLSTVDEQAASRVRAAEVGGRPFRAILAGTRAKWQRELGRVDLDAPIGRRRLFYTSLFRVMQTPVAITDPDGGYRGSDGVARRSAPGETRYTSWAIWDNYRTQLPLLALLDPRRAADIARSLVALYGEGKTRWATQTEPFLTVRTEHAGVALLDFRRRGIVGFDATAALAGMVRESDTLQRSTPDQRIEAAYDDWAIAELAQDLGRTDLATRFRQRALSYRPMWREVFERLGDDADVVKARGLYQGTLWQYRWAPVFDLDWMVETLGQARFLSELDTFFADGLFNMTNQPDIQTPWLYAALGQPERTARLVRRYMTERVDHPYANEGKRPTPFRGRSFALAPQGFADGMDDDAGAMSAWYVWGSFGIYPLVPGEPSYVMAPPLDREATIVFDSGRRLVIRRRGRDFGDKLSVNGTSWRKPRLPHETLASGSRLVWSR